MRSKKKKKSRTKVQRTGSVIQSAWICIAIGLCLFMLCSCFSFDKGDWPSKLKYPNNDPAANLCGSIGAFCAYYSLYYIGPGIFLVLVSVIFFFIMKLIKRPLDQLVLRSIGLVLVTIAASTSFHCLWPERAFDFGSGSGGVIGIMTAQLLSHHFASLGTFILVLAVWIVGAILLADSVVFTMIKGMIYGTGKAIGIVGPPAISAAKQHSQTINEIWRKLSVRQKRPEVITVNKEKVIEKDDPKRLENIPVKRLDIKQPVRPKTKPVKRTVIQPSYDDYVLPPLDLLVEPETGYASIQEKIVKSKASALEQLLSEFNVNARVVAADTGPVVTMFELELAAGVKVSHISALANDMARALGVGAVRVVAPLPGKHTIGIEVPNSEKEKVRIKSLIDNANSKVQRMQIPLFLGKDSSGEPLISDLAKMPHLLIAGTTGSGKSVCINSIITGVLLTKRPDEVKMILIDPKMVEMTAFNNIPHLMCPIVTETKMAVQILEWATVKMDERYAILAEARVKNIEEYNKLGEKEIFERFNPDTDEEKEKIPKKLPYIIIIIDELADLMMTAAKEIESYIVRLAQKSRAIGIHIILATQRPQATVVTGLIKSNMPCRVGFRVAARMDSRIILDQNGAETLLGEGDMLFLKPGTSELVRAQGTFLEEIEIRGIVKHLKEIAEPQFHPELTQIKTLDTSDMVKDELFDDAVRIVLQSKRGSVSLLQRRLSIGYARASRIIETMASSGILGEYKGSQAREVMMTLEEYENVRNNMQADADAGYKDMNDENYEENEESSDEPAYISEGQREYMSIDSDE